MPTRDSEDLRPLWTAAQVARRLQIPKQRVYFFARTGRLPCIRLGLAVRFDPDVVRAWERAGGWASPNLKRKQPSKKRGRE